MMRKYAAPGDKQPELRTKVSDTMWTAVRDYAELYSLSDYAAVRQLLAIALAAVHCNPELGSEAQEIAKGIARSAPEQAPCA